ncbi:MAG: zf-TFIIB domain-containing protein [Opitutaceae bacterium]
MKCPRDHSRLEEISTEEITVSVCPSCHGLLLHQGEFDKIKQRTKIQYPKTKRTEIEILEATATSPVNGETMKVINHDGIKIDVCLSSNYIWFDHGELEALFKKKNKQKKPDSDQSFNIFDAIDAIDISDFVSDLLGSVFDNASDLIDF